MHVVMYGRNIAVGAHQIFLWAKMPMSTFYRGTVCTAVGIFNKQMNKNVHVLLIFARYDGYIKLLDMWAVHICTNFGRAEQVWCQAILHLSLVCKWQFLFSWSGVLEMPDSPKAHRV